MWVCFPSTPRKESPGNNFVKYIFANTFTSLKLGRARNSGKRDGISDVVNSSYKLYKPFKSKTKTSMGNCIREKNKFVMARHRNKSFYCSWWLLKNRENHIIQLYPPILAIMVKVFNLIHIAVDPNTTSSSPCSDFAHPTGLRGDQGALPSGFHQ